MTTDTYTDCEIAHGDLAHHVTLRRNIHRRYGSSAIWILTCRLTGPSLKSPNARRGIASVEAGGSAPLSLGEGFIAGLSAAQFILQNTDSSYQAIETIRRLIRGTIADGIIGEDARAEQEAEEAAENPKPKPFSIQMGSLNIPIGIR